MPGIQDTPMDGAVDQNDVILNRINLQLARSRSILQSWTTLKSESANDEEDDLDDNDDDFYNIGEAAGIGAKVKDNDEAALPARRSAQKDKLLEQLIGKKAANAKRKEDAHKSMSASKHAAPKPLTNKPSTVKTQEESESEEEGRAAAFRPKKSAGALVPPPDVRVMADGDEDDSENLKISGRSSKGQPSEVAKGKPGKEAVSQRQKRKGGGTYLDELLSKKSKKKKKQKT